MKQNIFYTKFIPYIMILLIREVSFGNCEIAFSYIHTIAEYAPFKSDIPRFAIGTLLNDGALAISAIGGGDYVKKALDDLKGTFTITSNSGECKYKSNDIKYYVHTGCNTDHIYVFPPCDNFDNSTLTGSNPWWAPNFYPSLSGTKDEKRFINAKDGLILFNKKSARLLEAWPMSKNDSTGIKIEYKILKNLSGYNIPIGDSILNVSNIKSKNISSQIFTKENHSLTFTQLKYVLNIVDYYPEHVMAGIKQFESIALFVTFDNSDPILFAHSGHCEEFMISNSTDNSYGFKVKDGLIVIPDFVLTTVADINNDGYADYFNLENSHYLYKNGKFYSLYVSGLPC